MELGQMMFGNPTGDYETEEWVDALVAKLLGEIDRVYWNINQKEWDRHVNPELPGVHFRPYYWGDDEIEASKPNLAFIFSEQDIRWYKHPGRSQTSKLLFTNEQWIDWFNEGLKTIRESDTD